MKNLGILIDRTHQNQKFRLLADSLNKLPSDINTTVFSAEPGPVPVDTTFPIMNLVYAYGFNGVLISTDIYTTLVMNNCLRATKKYFYVWDIEYLYHHFGFVDLQKTYNNPNIELIARNKFRQNVISKTWKKPSLIIEDFNYANLEQLF